MISIFNEKLLEKIFSGCFSLFIVMQLEKLEKLLGSSFTMQVVFVIMFIVIAIYVHRIVSADK